MLVLAVFEDRKLARRRLTAQAVNINSPRILTSGKIEAKVNRIPEQSALLNKTKPVNAERI